MMPATVWGGSPQVPHKRYMENYGHVSTGGVSTGGFQFVSTSNCNTGRYTACLSVRYVKESSKHLKLWAVI